MKASEEGNVIQSAEFDLFDDDLLDFGFDELDFQLDCTSCADSTSSRTITNQSEYHKSDKIGNVNRITKKAVVKAKRGSQFMRKSKTQNIPHLGECALRPNVSRRKPAANMLYAFPNFDKSDALLYFPNTLSKHINSGDFPAMGILFKNHMDKQCTVSIFDCIYNMNAQSMLHMCEIMHELRPDFIMCIHSTKVIENTIRAHAYMKFTDVKQIYNSVAHSVKDPLFTPLFSQKREEKLRNGLKVGSPCRTEEEEQRLIGLVETDEDILLYAAMDIVVTFDHITKKIIGLEFIGRVTSIEPIENSC